MTNRTANTAAYDSAARRYERRTRNALADLREALEKAERRLDSADERDRGLLSSSGTEVSQQAAAFAEAAAAWTALREVSFLVEQPEVGYGGEGCLCGTHLPGECPMHPSPDEDA